MQDHFQTQWLIKCGLLAATTAVLSQIIIPIGPVPINLALLSVLIAGGLLPVRYALGSQMVYILLGCLGLPVFAGFGGGVGVAFGPTGGYIWGYLLAAAVTSWCADCWGREGIGLIGAMVVGVALCYGAGTAWFMYLTGNGLWASLLLCVIPFLLGDGFKILVAAMVVKRLK